MTFAICKTHTATPAHTLSACNGSLQKHTWYSPNTKWSSIYALTPDIVVWLALGKEILLVELTVSCEENMELDHERKKTKYDTLRIDIGQDGLHVTVLH